MVIDGQTVGTTPLTLEEVAAGEIAFELSAERYLAVEDVITVEGRGITQRYSKDLVPDGLGSQSTLSPKAQNILLMACLSRKPGPFSR